MYSVCIAGVKSASHYYYLETKWQNGLVSSWWRNEGWLDIAVWDGNLDYFLNTFFEASPFDKYIFVLKEDSLWNTFAM